MTSFLSRDTTYDLIVSIWRMIHPSVPVSALPDGGSVQDTEDDADIGSMESVDEVEVSAKRNRKRTRGRRRGEASEGGTAGEKNGLLTRAATGSPRGSRSDLKMHPPTIDACPAMRNLKETCMDVVFPSAPEKIYNLMFTSGFMREFWISNQKLMGASGSFRARLGTKADPCDDSQSSRSRTGRPKNLARTSSRVR